MNFSDYLKNAAIRNNKHLTKAKTTKDDEFYTSYDHAEMMIRPFAKHLRGKKVLCNCDDPAKSQIYDFLYDNFTTFGLKQLVGVGFEAGNH